MKKIGQGRTAEVFDCGDDRVVKLYFPQFSQLCEEEAGVARAIDALELNGLPVPKFFGATEMDGRVGLLYEKASGESLLARLLRMENVQRDVALLADLHKQVLSVRYPGGRDVRDRLRYFLERVQLPAQEMERVMALFHALPDGDRLLHGDFHPDNVQVGDKMWVLDWLNATRGDPLSDIARTVVLLTVTPLPEGLPQAQADALQVLRMDIAKQYVAHMGVEPEKLMPWVAVHIAAKVSETPEDAARTRAFLTRVLAKMDEK